MKVLFTRQLSQYFNYCDGIPELFIGNSCSLAGWQNNIIMKRSQCIRKCNAWLF